MDPRLGQSLDFLSLCFFSIFDPAVPLDRKNSVLKFLTMRKQPHLSTFYLRCTLQIPSPHYWAFHLRSRLLSVESLSPLRSLVHSRGSPYLLVKTSVAYFNSFYWVSGLLSCSPQYLTMFPFFTPCPLLSRPAGPSSSWVRGEQQTCKRNERKGKKRGDQEGFLSRSQFIRLKCQVISTQQKEIGRG